MSPSVYVVTLNLREVAFADKAIAESVVAQWNADCAGAVAELRAQGLDRSADRVTGRMDERPQDDWAQHGPGGMGAVWTRMPDRQIVHHALAVYKPDGTCGRQSEWWGPAWEFEPDAYTTKAAVHAAEYRPGMHAETEASARGTDEQAVAEAFTKGREEALRICERHQFGR